MESHWRCPRNFLMTKEICFFELEFLKNDWENCFILH